MMITRSIDNGKVFNEEYFVNDSVASRKRYEKAREKYEDMPAADSTIVDWGAGLLKLVGQEKRAKAAKAKSRQPNPEEARKEDAFCQEIMAKGAQADAVEWVKIKGHTLGEKNWATSKRLVDRLWSLGCTKIIACEIAAHHDGENTGHLVIELPKIEYSEARKQILKSVGRIAGESGYDGPFDDGQQFVYIKLD